MSMKRKLYVLVCLLFILIYFSKSNALAGDAYFEVYINKEPQDALLIGKVISIEENNILNIEILRVVCGEIKESQIKYSNSTVAKNTSEGKYVFLSVKKENDTYTKCFGVCYEVDIVKNDKISKMKPLDREHDEEWDVSMQWFANTGTTIDSDDERKCYEYETGVDGEVTETLVYDLNDHKWYKDPLSDEYISPNTQNTKKINYIFWGRLILFIFVLVVCVSVYLYRRIFRKRKCEKH